MKRAIVVVLCWLAPASAAWPANLSDDASVASRIELLDHWIRTQMDDDGKVTRLDVGVNYSEPVR